MSKKTTRKATTRRATHKTSRELELPAADAHARAVKGMAPYLADFQRAANDQTAADFGEAAVMDKQGEQHALRRSVKRAVVKKTRERAGKKGKTG